MKDLNDGLAKLAADGENVLALVYQNGKYAGDYNKRLQKERSSISKLQNAGIPAQRVVTDIEKTISTRALPIVGCAAAHEGDGPFCPQQSKIVPNIGCLHMGESPLFSACTVLEEWGLLPWSAAAMQRRNLWRTEQVAIKDQYARTDRREPYFSLDEIASTLWRNDFNPRSVEWWHMRYTQLAQFRDAIRQALLHVKPYPSIKNQLSSTREALGLFLKRPKRIGREEMCEGLRQTGFINESKYPS